MPEWLGVSGMSNVSQTLANWELLFQCFDSIQLPSSGNNDKQSGYALIRTGMLRISIKISKEFRNVQKRMETSGDISVATLTHHIL